MPELDALEKEFPYNDTVTERILNGALQVTMAEASAERNLQFALTFLKVSRRHDAETFFDLPVEAMAALICESCLRGWDLTIDGAPVPIDQAQSVMMGSAAGHRIFQECMALANNAELFKKKPSKKKRSSTTSRKPSPSAARRKKSNSAQKPPASTSLSESATT